MDEVDRLISEKNAVLESIEEQLSLNQAEEVQQKKKVQSYQSIFHYRDLDNQRDAEAYLAKAEKIYALMDMKIVKLNEYLEVILRAAGIKVASNLSESRAVSSGWSQKNIDDFKEQVLMKIQEYKLTKKNNPKNANIKRAAIFRVVKEPFRDEKLNMVNELLAKLNESEVPVEQEPKEEEQESEEEEEYHDE